MSVSLPLKNNVLIDPYQKIALHLVFRHKYNVKSPCHRQKTTHKRENIKSLHHINIICIIVNKNNY